MVTCLLARAREAQPIKSTTPDLQHICLLARAREAQLTLFQKHIIKLILSPRACARSATVMLRPEQSQYIAVSSRVHAKRNRKRVYRVARLMIKVMP